MKKYRSQQMHELAAQLKAKELTQHLGNTYSVLWEQQVNRNTGQWAGYTPHYHKIVSDDASIRAAEIKSVMVNQVSKDGLKLVNCAGNREIHTNFSNTLQSV